MRSILLGSAVTLAAVALRLCLPAAVAGEQAIFSFPAIVFATLLFGAWAGSAAAVLCFVLLWYYVIPLRHSFVVAGMTGAITLLVYALVATALVWAITRMRTALARYRQLTARLERLVEERTAERNRVWERSRELVAILDDADRLAQANPAFRDRLGEELTAPVVPFEELLVEEDRAAYRAVRDLPAALFEARLATPHGVAWVSWSITRDGAQRHLIGRDYTTERECGEMLEQSQKMELVGQMAGGLAHDFGNLLTPIGMTLDLLDRRNPEDNRARALIDTARESVGRADELIRRLLELSRPGAHEATVRPLGPLLEELAPLLRQVVGGRELRLAVAPDLGSVRVDTSQLDMALLNLVVNARDATGSNGLIQLSAEPVDGNIVRIAIADNGHGMDAATLARAAEPFFTTKDVGKGSGLGLPMVHNFAAAAGGRLAIESDPEGGTRVVLTLPVAPDGS